MTLLPTTGLSFGGHATCPPYVTDALVLHWHVVKHVLGARAIAAGAPWDAERWTDAPLGVTTAGDRDGLVASILARAGGRCAVDALTGQKPRANAPAQPCLACAPALAKECSADAAAIAERYAHASGAVLTSLADPLGTVIRRDHLGAWLLSFLRREREARELTVASFGRGPEGGPFVARFTRGDGVRVEAYVDTKARLRWRTTYRDARAVATLAQLLSFLSEMPRATGSSPLSGLCVVPRPGAQHHA